MCIKKVMRFCATGQRNWTNQWIKLAAQNLHLKCCFGHSEMPELKSVVRVVQYNYLPYWTRLHSQTAGIRLRKLNKTVTHLLHFNCTLWSASTLLYMIKDPQWLFLLQMTFFLVIFGASLSGSDNFVLFVLLDRNGACKCLVQLKIMLNSQL